ncbi:unnamed protein product [Phytophthora lilii]|uniref:Unnamed protein product n=1 Tax=Phytophthora lilii TaxID=2077276 RepID=A0A9W6WSV7_9STRA|nr:unnamed protein product [Phytophthora lilii]
MYRGFGTPRRRGRMSRSGKKTLALTRVKDLSPALCNKEVNVKAIVLESNAKDEANASNNATLLVGDDSGCVSLVLPKTAAQHVRLGDVLQLANTQVVLKSSRIYLWGGKVERVGEFLMLFKESANVSNITWVKDPKNPDVLVSSRLSSSSSTSSVYGRLYTLQRTIRVVEPLVGEQTRPIVGLDVMDDEREEEKPRDAIPPSPVEEVSHAEAADSVEASIFNTERRKSIHRQSIIYPLATDFLPVGTVVHDTPRKHSSSHSLFSSEVGFSHKIHPSDFLRSSSSQPKNITREFGLGSEKNLLSAESTADTEPTVQVDMQIFPLRFRDIAQEEAFCKHFNVYVTAKVRGSSRIVILINFLMLVAQYLTQTRVLHDFVFDSRVAIIALSLAFQAATYTSWFRRRYDRYLLLNYVLLDFVHQLPRFAFLMSSLEEEKADSNGYNSDQLTLFASQKSVRAMNLVFILIIYIASGLRFTMASICACSHMAFKGLFAVIFCHACTWDDVDATTNLAMISFCTLTAYHSERYVRQEFVERLRVDEERKRRDDLLETMLPVHIKERLKDNHTDGLAESYDEVSILFCYVSNFQALSKHASAIELVQLMNRIVFCFDRATDLHGVYKVEAIAETYMCASGVPKRDPFHCEKVAEMALTMMQICEKESWSFNGVDIQLQIGIHSGPVVAGVVGSKTYSYHLFGDTVNTSSRVCSSGCAGRIQISDRSRQLLSRTESFIISERGTMNLKGKGMVQLFWLEGKRTNPYCSRFACSEVYDTFETAMEESIRAKDLEYKSPLHHRSDDYLSCMKDVEIRRLTLDFRRKWSGDRKKLWLKFPVRLSRVQAAPEGLTSSKFQSDSKSMNSVRSIQSVRDTATEMERTFRIEHIRDSTPQFCVSLYMSVIYLLVTIIYRAYKTDVRPNKAARDTRAYSIFGVTIMLLLTSVRLLQKYPRFAKLKERWGTGVGLVFIFALNAQMLTASDMDSIKDSLPRGEQRITFLDGNLLYALIIGLAMRLRFRNAVLVNMWGFGVFVGCASLRHSEPWADLSESFCLLLTEVIIAAHFGYKRELGLRHDFLLKCTLQLEKQKCEDLLTNMLPSKQYAEALMQQSTIVDELAEVTLLYSDMVGFTPLGAKLNPEAICVMLNQIYSAFDRHLDDLGVYKMDTVGDAFIVVGGFPTHKSSKHHAAAIAAFAVEMLREIERFCAEANVTLQMRIGIHTGNVVGGVVGIKKPRYLIWGRHTVIANLMESRGAAGRIQISETTYELLRGCPEFCFDDRTEQVQISENDAIRTYFLTPNHHTVKDSVVARYLQEAHRVNTADIFALDQLRSCLLPSNNSPLSKRLEVPLSSRRHSDQNATTSAGEAIMPTPALVKTVLSRSMINDR